MASYQILSWHGIPVQVRAKQRRKRVSVLLPDRFQTAVDKAAMSAKLIGDEAYINGFEWGETKKRAGSMQEVADAVAAELDAQYPTIEWRKIALALRAKNKS
ncbi:MAG: virulence factor [Ardenticatenaceae bacterium]